MASSSPTRTYTPEDVEAMDDPILYELIDGELVERNLGTESGAISILIAVALSRSAGAVRLGYVLGSEVALHIYTDNRRNFRRADLSFVRRDRLPDGRPPKGDLFLAPDLVVEVISPNDLAVKVEEKAREYVAAGVELVWIVYPDTGTVHAWRRDGTVTLFSGDQVINAEPVLPGFECPVREFFPE